MKICYQDSYFTRFQSRIGCCLQVRFFDSKYIQFSDSILSKYDHDFLTSVDEEGRICLLFFDNLAVLNVYFPCGSEYAHIISFLVGRKMHDRVFENGSTSY